MGKLGNAIDGGLADRRDRLLGEEGLMAGNDDIRERQQALEHVIGNDGARQVAEEQISLLLVNIQRQAAQLAAFQGFDNRLGIDQSPAAGIDKQRAPFCPHQRVGIDNVVRFRRQRAMQRNDIGPGADFPA